MNCPDANLAKPLKDLPFSGEAVHRLELADAQHQICQGFVIHSSAGTTVKFGEILKRHLELEKGDQRPRFLEARKSPRGNRPKFGKIISGIITSRGCGG